jgi:hypothetical protein
VTQLTTLATIKPYVEQLLDDSDVQDHLSRSAANLRAARRRAAAAKSKKQALTDGPLRRRLASSVREAVLANTTLQQAREKQQRRDRRRRRAAVGLLVLTGAVAYLAVDVGARDRAFDAFLGLLGRPETAPTSEAGSA